MSCSSEMTAIGRLMPFTNGDFQPGADSRRKNQLESLIAMGPYDGVPPANALKFLEDLTRGDFQKGIKSQGLSAARAELLFEVIQNKTNVKFYLGVDIRRYALKCLFPDFYASLSLGDHIYSTSELYDYDPPKNGQNIIKHGLSFREVVSYSSQFGTLLVPCPDNNNGTRCVIFSDLDAGVDGKNLNLPMLGMTGQIYTISVAQQSSKNLDLFPLEC